jgi:DNA-binding protein HU-beta
MNRKELVGRLADQTGLYGKTVNLVIGTFIEEIQTALARGEVIKIQGLGTFDLQSRAPRTGRDLTSGEFVEVPARSVPRFRPSRLLREKVESEKMSVCE